MTARRDRARGRTRLVSGLLAGYGAVQLVAPGWVVRTLTPGVPEPSAWVVRLLGGRLVLQHCLVLARPTRCAVLTGAAVDVVHAVSMLGVAAAWREYRRPALVSAASAGFCAVVELTTGPQASRW